MNEIDQYIAGFPKSTQKILEQVRKTIRKAAPEAEEKIGYGIPTFTLNGNLVHFAGYKNHIGFYPTPSGIETFKKELSVYDGAKGSVQFPIDQPMPLALIRQIVKFRVEQNQAKAKPKKAAKAPADSFQSSLSAPAQRALQNAGISSLKQLSKYSEAQILELHGMGPGSLPKLRSALAAEGLAFKKD